MIRVLAVALVLLAGLPAVASAETPPGATPFQLELVPVGGASPRSAMAWEKDGVIYVSINDISLLLGAVKYWRPELGRMTLAVGGHEMSVTDGSDIAVLDTSELLHLPGEAFRWEGRMLVPLAALMNDEGRARAWLGPLQLGFSRTRRVLSATSREGAIQGASITADPAGHKLVVRADVPIRVERIRTQRASFVLLLKELTYDPLLHPLPPEHDWFQGLRVRNLPEGVEVSFSASSAVIGYRLEQPERNQLVLFLGFDERDLRTGDLKRFSVARGLVPNAIRLVALDPGHGGSDRGASLGETSESYLAMDLARRVATHLKRTLEMDAIILREGAENPGTTERAERATHAGADLMISLHIHRRPGGPAAFVAMPEESGEPMPREAASLGFRESGRGQGPYLNSSRLLARSVVDAVAGRMMSDAQGVFNERLNQLQGVSMPAMVLEVPVPGVRAPNAAALDAVAQGVVEGIRFFLLAGGEQ
jgi:N-acetylmuramoyl-L-alanine amidase